MIITLDGPAGAGKSSAARALACRLGWCYMDTGAMYRAVTLVALEQALPLDDGERLAALAESLAIAFRDGRVFVGDRDVSTEIRTERITAATRPVADAPPVREAMKRMQRALAAGLDVVVVSPDKDFKQLLSPHLRLMRLVRSVAGPKRFYTLDDFVQVRGVCVFAFLLFVCVEG